MRKRENPPFNIVSNNSNVQAVLYKNALYCVFYTAETLASDNLMLGVNRPCMMILNFDKSKIYVSTPDKTVENVIIACNGKTYNAVMPENNLYKGSSVEIQL